MKKSILTLLFLGICGVQVKADVSTPQEFSFGASAYFGDAGSFHSSLSPYGEWLELDAGFYVWRPTHVQLGWRPYLHGRWAWTDYGWYWVSSEPFGWAVFHYGRCTLTTTTAGCGSPTEPGVPPGSSGATMTTTSDGRRCHRMPVSVLTSASGSPLIGSRHSTTGVSYGIGT